MISVLVIICIFILLLIGLIMFFAFKFGDIDIFEESKPKKVNVFASLFSDEMKLIDGIILDQYFEGVLYKNTSFFEDCCVDTYTYVLSKKYADEEGRIKDFMLAKMESLLSAEFAKEYNRKFANCYSPGFDFSRVIKVDLRTVEGRILLKRMYL